MKSSKPVSENFQKKGVFFLMYSLLDVLSPEGGDTDKETSGTGAEVALAALAG